jgi:hypothetical protein
MQVVPSVVGGVVEVSRRLACTWYGPGWVSAAASVRGTEASADAVVGSGTVVGAGTDPSVMEVRSSTE